MPKLPKIDLEEPKIDTSKGTREEDEIVTFVTGRFTDMRTSRVMVDKDWTNYQMQMDAIWQPYPDGRSSFALPLTRALVERGIAEEIRIPVMRQIRAERQDYQSHATTYEEVRKYCGRIGNYDWNLLRNAYTCWTYGTSILYTHFDRSISSQYEASFNAIEDVEYKKKYIIQNKICLDDFNINNFFPDNRVIEWSDAVDSCAIQVVPFETFRELQNQSIYKNIDKVQPTTYQLQNASTNLSEEERAKTGNYVHILNYWNLAKDMYVAIANGKTVIRCHPIWTTKKGAKTIPFTMRRLGYNQRSLYGIGMGYYGQQMQSNMNDVSEFIFDGVRRSTQETIIMGSNLDIEGQKILYGNLMLKANGLLNGNIDRFQGAAPNQAIFEARDMMLRDINRFIGLDLENLVADAGTAFQANLIAESQQKQVNVWLKNRDMAMEDVEDKLKDLIQNYFPLDVPYRIVDDPKADPETPSIEVEGKKYDKRSKKFTSTKNPTAKNVVDIDEDMLKGDYYVDVTTNTNEIASAAIRQDQVLKYVSAITPVIQSFMLAKEAGQENVINPQEIMDELGKAYNIPKKDKTNELELKAKGEEYKQELSAFAGTMGMNATPTPSPNQTVGATA